MTEPDGTTFSLTHRRRGITLFESRIHIPPMCADPDRELRRWHELMTWALQHHREGTALSIEETRRVGEEGER